MLKKIALVAVVAIAGALAVSPLAFASDQGQGSSGHTYKHKQKECGKNYLTGAFVIPPDSGSYNKNRNHGVNCD